MSRGNKISSIRTRKRLEQQSIDVAKSKPDAAAKPVGPAGENNVSANK